MFGMSSAVVCALLLLVELSWGIPVLDSQRPFVNQDGEERNRLLLACLDANDAEPMRDAVFFLNGDLFFDLSNHQLISDESRPMGRVNTVRDRQIVFSINRNAEGEYSCGIRHGQDSFTRSSSTLFVGE
jgi:hypothetical protein